LEKLDELDVNQQKSEDNKLPELAPKKTNRSRQVSGA